MGDYKPTKAEENAFSVWDGAQPLGTSLPTGDPHAVSFSLPTWTSVIGLMAGEDWVKNAKQTTYPRMGLCPLVSKLCEAAVKRLNQPKGMRCRIFTSHDAAIRLDQTLKKKDPTTRTYAIDFVPQSVDPEVLTWGRFILVLYADAMEEEANRFLLNHGDGISNRHAEFCLSLMPFMDTKCGPAGSQFCAAVLEPNISTIQPPPWTCSGLEEKAIVKSILADSIVSQKAGMAPVRPDDVFLYSTGMMAIGKIARVMSSTSKDATAVIYGWLYSGTKPLVEECGFYECVLYGHGSEHELDLLESSLAAGARYTVLFCEIPSNPQLHTPNLIRIKYLADKYGFTTVIDDTIGTSVNVDILPYADVVITSLTKIFNGACNAMGGSLIVNPNSKCYPMIHAQLQDSFEDVLFPLDAKILSKNCVDYADRVRRCSATAMKIAHLLAGHPLVEYVNYPTLVPSRAEYERYRREGEGYGYLLSIVFRSPDSAVQFYDALDLWKGGSIGNNNSIALPYSVLAHWDEQDWAASFGVPKHIVRLSVGLEPECELRARVLGALEKVEFVMN
ncbi:hypothetical protein PENARI_c056G03455 [Penicillium arizonense]|uniref:Cystathionine gamma-synthase n=1 Tax=Penicillium arizonense TaxID=1835702 RepID=A0A1F5L1T3_PENAI|nr:hypothetical protein PENARI_c056G03455 [Penicillium arizonense]OGE47198.1 hypothetical protein PENARI_c056G03455 [Penicillium arizonense]